MGPVVFLSRSFYYVWIAREQIEILHRSVKFTDSTALWTDQVKQ